MRVLVLLLLAGLTVGCAPLTVPVPEESMKECNRIVKMTERVYLDKSSEEILAAAARVFQLTGGGYTVTPTADGLMAQRSWSPVTPGKDTAPVGSDIWQLVVKEVSLCKGGYTVGYVEPVAGDPKQEVRGRIDTCGATARGMKLSVYHLPEVYEQNLIPAECFASPVFKPSVSKFTVTPALYELFFMRMDYLLAKSTQWPSCASYGDFIRNNVYYRDQFSNVNFQGHLDGLCVQVQDNAP